MQRQKTTYLNANQFKQPRKSLSQSIPEPEIANRTEPVSTTLENTTADDGLHLHTTKTTENEVKEVDLHISQDTLESAETWSISISQILFSFVCVAIVYLLGNAYLSHRELLPTVTFTVTKECNQECQQNEKKLNDSIARNDSSASSQEGK